MNDALPEAVSEQEWQKARGARGEGAEPFTPTWSIRDITPFGRQEEWEDTPAARPQSPPYEWRRLHDRYS